MPLAKSLGSAFFWTGNHYISQRIPVIWFPQFLSLFLTYKQVLPLYWEVDCTTGGIPSQKS